jgi:hypothetical protein
VSGRYIFPDNVSSDTEWRWADPSGQQRLVRTDELRAALASGVIAPNTPVWRQGWNEWKPATDVPELTSSALAAANGVVPNIPPPPMNVVAAQHAFEGAPVAKPDPSKAEPPPPPSYVPTPARPMGGTGPAPHYSVATNTNVNIRAIKEKEAEAIVFAKGAPKLVDDVPESERPTAVPDPKGSTAAAAPPAPPSASDLQKTIPVGIPSPAAAQGAQSRPAAPPPAAGKPAVPPATKSAPPPPVSKSAPPPPVSRSAPPPPPSRTPSPPLTGIAALVGPPAQKAPPPPPPKSMKPPPPSAKPPVPKAADAPKEVIEELSGSVLLADQSTSQAAIEELSGSVLLAEQSGSIHTGVMREKSGKLLLPDLSGPAPAMAPRANDELSANFLLDAGSTGALPSVESTGRILAAKAASRAPFAPIPEPPPSARATPAPIVPVALPLGSTPPPPPSTMLGGAAPAAAHDALPSAVPAPAKSETNGLASANAAAAIVPSIPTAKEFAAQPPPAAASEPFMVPQPPTSPEVPALRTLVGVPPPPDHVLAEVAKPRDTYATSPGALPIPERSTARLHDFRAMGHDPRAPYILAAFGVGGLLAIVGMIGLIVSAFHKKTDDVMPAPVSSAPKVVASQAPAAAAAPSAAPAPAHPAPAPVAGALGPACTLAGAAHVIAPRAVVQSGVEATIVGSRLALGFASRDKDGYAVAIDPSSAIAAQTVHVHAPEAIRRLVPIEGPHGLVAAADLDRRTDFLAGRRTVPAQRPFDLGFGGGGLAWAPYRSGEVDLLWTLDGDDPVEAIRAAPLDPTHEDTGWAIAFRRGTNIYAGAVNGGATFMAKGPLVKVASLGAQIGSPTVAAQDGAVLVAWADRAQPSDPWSLRWMRFAPGDATVEAKAFVPSEGGLGEQSMSPTIAAAGQGRFVIAWTEGPVSNHQVRAQTISGSGVPIGNAMGISDSGVNAGQAELAILPDGHGVVAYLASSGTGGKAYEVLATPIVCP